MDTLTKEDVTTLTRHFAPGEHEFVRGYVYITEQAITTRLDEVDPAWSWIIVDEHPRDNQMIVKGRLTVKGVTREGVGMQPLTVVSTKTGEILEGTEPEKSAATDALKRAARLFGIGRYLLDTPGWVKTVDHVATWLKQSNGKPSPTPPPPSSNPPPDNKPSTNGAHTTTPVVRNDTKIEALDKVTIEKFTGKGNSGGLRMKTSTGSYSYTRAPFTAAGIDTELWKEPGVVGFGKPFNVVSVWHQPDDPKSQAYWRIDRLEPMGEAEAKLFGKAPVIEGDF